ncbi:hypothetical protein Hanom_Chr15g01343561 [Helianthus anomalus]
MVSLFFFIFLFVFVFLLKSTDLKESFGLYRLVCAFLQCSFFLLLCPLASTKKI